MKMTKLGYFSEFLLFPPLIVIAMLLAWADVNTCKRLTNHSLAKPQAAIAIGTVLYAPVQGNLLVAAAFDQNIILTRDPLKACLKFSDDPSAKRRATSFDLPSQLAAICFA